MQVDPDRIFVGREGELDLMTNTLDHVAKGFGTAVSVVGEPGIGKSRLLSEFVQTRCDGLTVLFAKCHEDESQRPFGSVAQILRQAVQLYGPEKIADLIGDLTADLALAFPFLSTSPGSPVQPDTAAEQRQATLDALVSIFRILAGKSTLVLVVDNLHRADGESVAVFRRLVDHIEEFPSLLCVAYRNTVNLRRTSVGTLLAEMTKLSGFNRLLLRGLDCDALSILVSSTSGREDGPNPERIYEITEGHPLFATEVLRGWVSESQGLERLPEGLVEAIGSRFDALGEEITGILATAAVAGRAFALQAVSALNKKSAPALIAEKLDEAVSAGILRSSGRVHYEFVHALFREVLLGEMSTSRRLNLHAVMYEMGRGSIDNFEPSLLDHAREAVPVILLHEYLRVAQAFARNGLKQLADEETIRICDEALEMAVEDPETSQELLAEMLLLKGRALSGLDQWRKARNVLTVAFDAFERLGDIDHMTEAATTPVVYYHLGDHDLIERALTTASGENRGRLLWQLGGHFWNWYGEMPPSPPEVAATRAGYREAIAAAQESGDVETETWAAIRLGHLLLEGGDIEAGIEVLGRARELAVASGDLRAEFWIAEMLVFHCTYRRGMANEEIARMVERLEEIALGSSSKNIRLRAGIIRALHLWNRGELSQARGCVDAMGDLPEVLEMFVDSMLLTAGVDDDRVRDRMRTDSTPIDAYLRYSTYTRRLFTAVVDRGWTEMVPPWPDLDSVPEPRDPQPMRRPHMVMALAQNDSQLCQLEAAEAERRIALIEKERILDMSIEDWRMLAAVNTVAGNVDRALEILGDLIALSRERLLPLFLTLYLSDAATTHLQMAANSPADSGRGAENTAIAISELREACEIAVRCGALPLEEKCTTLLASIDAEETAQGRSELPDGLTVREAEVATLLVEGLTNREIGERLFISPRTVANHVQNLLNKTASGNRAEAAAYAIRHGLTT